MNFKGLFAFICYNALFSAAFVQHFGSQLKGRTKGVLQKSSLLSSPRWNLRVSATWQPGETVVVVGGSGKVGQLITRKLYTRGDFKVRVACRDVERGRDIFGDIDVQIAKVNLSDESNDYSSILKDAAAIVICVGTTAYPTTKWAGGNTPEAIDKIAVSQIANAAAKIDGIKKVVLVSSIGVERSSKIPFVFLNLFKVLDAKKSGEDAVIRAASQGSFDYVIVRPGQLLKDQKTDIEPVADESENDVIVAIGDTLLGDCKRDVCAEAVVQCLINDFCKNLAFSITSNNKAAPSDAQWKTLFQNLSSQNAIKQ